MNISIVKYQENTIVFSASILLLSYLTGILCIGFGLFPELLKATPFNLLLTFAILVFCCYGKNIKTLITVSAIYLLGLTVEVIGVHTGLLFGEYAYGQVLGPKLAGTPLLIGVNWFILLTGSIASVGLLATHTKSWQKALMVAGLMTFVDLILEPVAIHYGFWSWELEQVPIQNYVAWFVISFFMSYTMQNYIKIKNPLLAAFSLVCIFLFFVVLNLQIPESNGLSLSMVIG